MKFKAKNFIANAEINEHDAQLILEFIEKFTIIENGEDIKNQDDNEN